MPPADTPLALRGLLSVVLAAVATALSCALLAALIPWVARGLNAALPLWLHGLLLPALFMVIAAMTQRWAPAAAGGGIAPVLAALQLRQHRARRALLSLKVAAARLLMTAIALGAGTGLGREGPGVHLGAALHYALGRADRSQPEIARQLILSGAAAGVAATFGTPLAGLLFAAEALRGGWRLRDLLLPLLCALIAGGLTQCWQVEGALPAIPAVSHLHSLLAVLLCGLASGLAGSGFVQALLMLQRGLQRLDGGRPLWRAASCGLGLSALVAVSGGVSAADGVAELHQLLAGTPADTLASSFQYGLNTLLAAASGLPGGLVTPMLRLGARLGRELAAGLPLLPAPMLVLLCMTGLLAAVSRAPLAAAALLLEWLHAWPLGLPLLMVALLAASVSRQLCRQPLFDQLAAPWLKPAAGPADAESRLRSTRSDPAPTP